MNLSGYRISISETVPRYLEIFSAMTGDAGCFPRSMRDSVASLTPANSAISLSFLAAARRALRRGLTMSGIILSLNASCKGPEVAFSDLRLVKPCAIYPFVKRRTKKNLNPSDVALGAVVRRRRKSMGYTIDDVAEWINRSFSHVSKMERGETPFSLEMLRQIAPRLNTTWGELQAEAGIKRDPVAAELHARIDELSPDAQRSLLEFLRDQARRSA